MVFDPIRCPVFINCRDRVTDLRRLVAWLEEAGHERIVLLDNNSSYPELLEYFDRCPHDVIHFGQNLGSRAIWLSGLVPASEYWVLSDPDCVPIEDCPADAIAFLFELLGRFHHRKAGLGLYLDDTPDFPSKAWERSLLEPNVTWRGQIDTVAGAAVFDSLVDTSFALYRPGISSHSLPGLRTGWPYQCRHTSWYRYDAPTEEERYYLERAIQGPTGSSWADKGIIAWKT